MRKMLLLALGVIVLVGGLYFTLGKPKGSAKPSAEKEYDQADNERRNAEFLAAQRGAMQDEPVEQQPDQNPAELPQEPVVEAKPSAALPPQAPRKVVTHPTKPARTHASAFKAGMHTITKKCEIRKAPKASAKVIGAVAKGKKLWVGEHDKGWATVKVKSGPAYINKNCL
jgi:hypothetical protein